MHFVMHFTLETHMLCPKISYVLSFSLVEYNKKVCCIEYF